MPNVATLVYGACRNDAPACIEYSWVPTGQRHVINLTTAKASDQSTDKAEKATHVQVYSLRNGRYGVASSWQFPVGPAPGGKYLASATVIASGRQAIGYAVYEDGTAAPPSTVSLVPIDNNFNCGAPGRGGATR